MNLPLNAQTSTNVEILCLTPSGPVMFNGRARSGEANEMSRGPSALAATDRRATLASTISVSSSSVK